MRTIMWKKGTLMKIVFVVFVIALICAYISSRILIFKLSQSEKQELYTFQMQADRNELKNYQMSDLSESLGENPIIDVYVVEEHHEVLPYWFKSERQKIIPKTGNTLIHIDGHSDVSPPFYFEEFPNFRIPQNWKEVYAMMQRNDVFILGAAMTGLFKRVIWIWPLWDEPNHKETYFRQKLDIGIADVLNSKNIKQRVYCICAKNTTTRICSYIPQEETAPDEPIDREINPDQCKIKKSIVYEEIREDQVLDKIENEKWLSPDEDYMLDIDEDYYGCTHVVQALYDVNINIQKVELISTDLQQLICPKTVTQEKLADDILVQMLEIFKRSKNCNKSGKFNRNGILSCKTYDRITEEAEDFLFKKLWSGENKIACSREKKHSDHVVIKHLVKLFEHWKTEQIEELQKVGFCLSTTLKSFQVTYQSSFRVCHGNNIPEESAVLVHNPTNDDILKRTQLLKKILTSIERYKPKMVTLCRSVRDGYTPRKLFNQIESDIMKSLNSSFKRLKFHYDEWLIGGKNGWQDRHE